MNEVKQTRFVAEDGRVIVVQESTYRDAGVLGQETHMDVSGRAAWKIGHYAVYIHDVKSREGSYIPSSALMPDDQFDKEFGSDR